MAGEQKKRGILSRISSEKYMTYLCMCWIGILIYLCGQMIFTKHIIIEFMVASLVIVILSVFSILNADSIISWIWRGFLTVLSIISPVPFIFELYYSKVFSAGNDGFSTTLELFAFLGFSIMIISILASIEAEYASSDKSK